jgi:hypothetical protein
MERACVMHFTFRQGACYGVLRQPGGGGNKLTTLRASASARRSFSAFPNAWIGPYRLRKQLPEPVFGQIKQARGFRQFLMRGFEKVRAEWAIICSIHNLLKLLLRRSLSAASSMAAAAG